MRRDWKPDWADDVSPETVEALRDQYMPEMPPLDVGGYLVGYLMDAGPVVNTGMGAIALRSEHLIYWQQETGVNLTPVEARCIRRLSQEYMNESHRAEKLGCIPPWIPPDFKPEKTAAQLALRALANS